MATYKEINGIKYLVWNRFYWLEIGKYGSCCGKVNKKYRKFRMFKGELQELKTGMAICSDCQSCLN